MEDTIEFLEEMAAELETALISSNCLNFSPHGKCSVEIALEKLHKKITEIRVKQKKALGWEEVHLFIETATYCHHKEQIIITRYCPKCKRFPHDNVCNVCITEEDMECYQEIQRTHDDNDDDNNPYGFYFRKKICDDCCRERTERETWIRSKCTAAAA